MNRLGGALIALLAVSLVAVPLWFAAQGAGTSRVVPRDERTVRSSGARVFIGGGVRSGK